VLTREEITAAEFAAWNYLEKNPKAKETIGMANHRHVVGMIRAALEELDRHRDNSRRPVS